MKKLLFLGLILLQSGLIYSQLNKDGISFELRYPIPLGDNFLNKGFENGYTGIVDFGIDYSILNYGNLSIGLTFNSAILRLSENDLTLWTLTPKVKFDYAINFNKLSIIPRLGFGYSNWRYYAIIQKYSNTGEPLGTSSYNYNNDGLTIQVATKLLINAEKRVNGYFLIAYEFTKLEKPENGAIDSKFNRNLHILYPGVGLIWKFIKDYCFSTQHTNSWSSVRAVKSP